MPAVLAVPAAATENSNAVRSIPQVQRLPGQARNTLPPGIQRVAIRRRSKPVKDPEEEARKKAERAEQQQDQPKTRTPAEIATAAKRAAKAEMGVALQETVTNIQGLAEELHQKFPFHTVKWFHDAITHKSKFTHSREVSAWNVHSARMLDELNSSMFDLSLSVQIAF